MSEGHSHKSVTLLAFALLFFALFQLSQILIERSNLEKLKTQMAERVVETDKVLADNQKMLDQLNNIATGTKRLADAGNENAKRIVGQLEKAGIKIDPNFKENAAKAAAKAAAEAANPPAQAMPASEAPPEAPAP